MESEPTPAQRATAALLDGVGISENPTDVELTPGLPTPLEPRISDTVSDAIPMAPRSPLRRAAKRTASGAIKDSGGLHPPLAPPATVPRRSHHTRGASTGSELSSRLRTNLSYALLKVRNGWEARSLDDLEEQASRQAVSLSPVRRPMYPTLSDRTSEPPHHQLTARRPTATITKQQSAPEALAALVPSTPKPRSLSRPGSGAALATPNTLPGGRRAHARVRSQGPIRSPGLDDYAFSPTYASPGTAAFPRPHPLGEDSTSEESHEDERTPNPRSDMPPSSARPTWIPTYADARSPRRNTIGGIRPSGMTNPGAIPRSTASQPDSGWRNGSAGDERLGQAEQDALETLMFMSSPGNSQNIASRA